MQLTWCRPPVQLLLAVTVLYCMDLCCCEACHANDEFVHEVAALGIVKKDHPSHNSCFGCQESIRDSDETVMLSLSDSRRPAVLS